MPAARQIALEVRERPPVLLDEPLGVRAAGEGLAWRARYRDDDGRVWRSAADDPEELALRWAPAKTGTGDVAALLSLRPLPIDVRVEAADGRAAAGRTLKRLLVAPGVRIVRWREGGTVARLCLPAPDEPAGATVLIDATRGAGATAASLAAPLLASRGAVVAAVTKGLDAARELLAAVPAAQAQDVIVLRALDAAESPGAPGTVSLPPNVGARGGDAAARAAAWDALLAALHLSPRHSGAGGAARRHPE